jgi:hypothetical protein
MSNRSVIILTGMTGIVPADWVAGAFVCRCAPAWYLAYPHHPQH